MAARDQAPARVRRAARLRVPGAARRRVTSYGPYRPEPVGYDGRPFVILAALLVAMAALTMFALIAYQLNLI